MNDKKDKLKAIKFYINLNEEEKFRKNAMMKYGYTRGALSLAAQDAISYWNRHFSTPTMTLDELNRNPVRAIRGLLKGKTKKTAIELQHTLGKILTEKNQKKSR